MAPPRAVLLAALALAAGARASDWPRPPGVPEPADARLAGEVPCDAARQRLFYTCAEDAATYLRGPEPYKRTKGPHAPGEHSADQERHRDRYAQITESLRKVEWEYFQDEGDRAKVEGPLPAPPATDAELCPPGDERPRRAAIVFRGISFRLGFDGRFQQEALENTHSVVVKAMKARGYEEVDLFFTVYKPESGWDYEKYVGRLVEWGKPRVVISLPQARAQGYMHVAAMYSFTHYQLATGRPYDLMMYTRFDLLFKMSPTDTPGFAPDKFNFMWKEIVGSWRNNLKDKSPSGGLPKCNNPPGMCRVPDTVMVTHGAYSSCMLWDVTAMFVETGTDQLHTWFGPTMVGLIGQENVALMLPDSYHDSDPEKGRMVNPIYDLQRNVGQRAWWTDECDSWDKFTQDDPETGSWCCPMDNYCCPWGVRDCTTATVEQYPTLQVAKQGARVCKLKEHGREGTPANHVQCASHP